MYGAAPDAAPSGFWKCVTRAVALRAKAPASRDSAWRGPEGHDPSRRGRRFQPIPMSKWGRTPIPPTWDVTGLACLTDQRGDLRAARPAIPRGLGHEYAVSLLQPRGNHAVRLGPVRRRPAARRAGEGVRHVGQADRIHGQRHGGRRRGHRRSGGQAGGGAPNDGTAEREIV